MLYSASQVLCLSALKEIVRPALHANMRRFQCEDGQVPVTAAMIADLTDLKTWNRQERQGTNEQTADGE